MIGGSYTPPNIGTGSWGTNEIIQYLKTNDIVRES